MAAFRASAKRAHAALTDPALLHRTFGPQEAPGAFVAQMLVNEPLTHGWDLARATGQHIDMAPATAERALPAARAFYGDMPRTATTYRSEQPPTPPPPTGSPPTSAATWGKHHRTARRAWSPRCNTAASSLATITRYRTLIHQRRHRLANARSEATNTHLLLTRRTYGYLAAPKIADATP